MIQYNVYGYDMVTLGLFNDKEVADWFLENYPHAVTIDVQGAAG